LPKIPVKCPCKIAPPKKPVCKPKKHVPPPPCKKPKQRSPSHHSCSDISSGSDSDF
jgi:hypothetical protein